LWEASINKIIVVFYWAIIATLKLQISICNYCAAYTTQKKIVQHIYRNSKQAVACRTYYLATCNFCDVPNIFVVSLCQIEDKKDITKIIERKLCFGFQVVHPIGLIAMNKSLISKLNLFYTPFAEGLLFYFISLHTPLHLLGWLLAYRIGNLHVVFHRNPPIF